ncbi:MAG: T9SS type A sorting domain-containing protein [Bacteroidales bacterium]|nr:T9SS type A sorting domain-containing protein [Bacteroidales bacterium]
MRILTFAIAVFLGVQVFAQQSIIINAENQNNLEFVSSTQQTLQVSFTIHDLNITSFKTENGEFCQIHLFDAVNMGEIGCPELPTITKMIRIPENAELKIVVQSAQYTDIDLADYGIYSPLFPEQGHQTKDNNVKDFIKNKSAYSENVFSGNEIVQTEVQGHLRNMRIALLKISPVQYNPVQNTIRVYHSIDFAVVYKNANWAQSAELDKKYGSFLFSSIENEVFNTDIFKAQKDTNTQYPVKMIIVADTMFHDALQPFIQWKTKKGFIVEEAYTSNPAVGTTTTSIKSYLQSSWDNASAGDPAQSFILIVGDVAQIPAFSGTAGSHFTDMYYAEYTGDVIPEVFFGRFSATSVAELQPQIDKTLEYEQYLFPTETWLDTVVMVAGVDGSFGPVHGNGQINYGITYYFNASQGLYSYTHLYPNSGSEAAQIRSEIGQGVSFANYTAHGSTSGWADPSFVSTDVPSMNNNHKYPLMIGNACSTNTFSSDCFGETLLRIPEKGAIGYIGGSNSTYWDEDFYWAVGVRTTIDANPVYSVGNHGSYDRLWHINGEPFSEWFVSQGQMVMAGNMAVLQSGNTSYTYYSEIYHLMGDPSLMPYIGIPSQLTVSHPPLVPIGQSSIAVTTEPYAYVGVSQNGVWHGAGIADATGNLTINIIPFTIPGNIDIVGTKQFRKPYVSTFIAQNPTGPYVLYDANAVIDVAGNNNQMADFKETVDLNVRLKNYGLQNDTTVYAILSTTDPYVEIIDSVGIWGLMYANDTLTLSQAFTIKIDTLIPDQHIAGFNLSIRDSSSNVWPSNFNILLNAPVLKIMDLTIDDSGSGNGNNKLDAGETVDISISAINNGHADIDQAMASLSTISPYITINSSQHFHDTLNQALMEIGLYNISVNAGTPLGQTIDLTLDLVAGLYSDSKTFVKSVGQVDEDWETGDMSQFAWIIGGDVPWTITSGNPYEGSFAAMSGDIGDDQTSTLSIDINVLSADTLSFYKKVSCEEGWSGTLWDYLDFQVDGTSKGKWGGEIAWSEEKYALTMGYHELTWLYFKDGSISSGSDAAWVDYIIFPPMIVVTGLEEDIIQNNVRVSPNPAVDHTTVQFMHEGGAFSIQIYDVQGKLLREINAEAPAGQLYYPIDVETLEQGIYTLLVTTDKQYFSSQFVKTN